MGSVNFVVKLSNAPFCCEIQLLSPVSAVGGDALSLASLPRTPVEGPVKMELPRFQSFSFEFLIVYWSSCDRISFPCSGP